MKNLKLGLAALFICSTVAAFADDSLAWTGYMRAGAGITSDAGVEGINENYLGRFGNEYNTWVNSKLNKKFTGTDGSWAAIALDAYGWVEDPSNTGPWAGKSSATVTSDNGSFYIGETSVTFGKLDFLPEEAILKVGQFGVSEDIHVLDYKFKNVGGTGVRYQNKNLALGLFINESYGTKAIDGEYSTGNIQTKLTVAQKLENSDSSVSAMIAYNQKKLLGVLPGSTKYIAEAGVGVTSNKLCVNTVTDKRDSGLRLIVDGHSDMGKLIVNPVIWFETTNYGDDSKDMYSSLTAGGRVTQKITNNLEMMYEGFVDTVANKGGTASKDGVQYKLAAGPAIQLKMGEWVRPVARFAVTYIGGDKDITGLTKTSEVRLGTQFEAWF